jgi:uncharacterized membrane protein
VSAEFVLLDTTLELLLLLELVAEVLVLPPDVEVLELQAVNVNNPNITTNAKLTFIRLRFNIFIFIPMTFVFNQVNQKDIKPGHSD